MTAAERPDVAAFYFPGFHRDARNDVWKHPGFDEWELVRTARPRFVGHHQPLHPQWGYADESDPEVLARSCAVAARHGLTAFVFDWYSYDGRDFLNGALDRGYLATPDQPVRFALHWANHTWRDVFPAPARGPARELAPAQVTPEEFAALTDRVIERYLLHPGYWRVAGGAFFSWHEFVPFVDWMGGWSATADVLADFRARARRAGAGELHLACVGAPAAEELVRLAEVGIDSVTPYNWLHVLPVDEGETVPYRRWLELALDDLRRFTASPVPYAPNLTMGWDSTPRVAPEAGMVVDTWPRLPVVVGNTPEEFGRAARRMAEAAAALDAPYLSVNAWNEWTEGSYLEPEMFTGMGYLQALHRATRPETSALEKGCP